MRFLDKVVVVTGGAQGIRRALAESFLEEGAVVAVIDKESSDVNCDYFFQGDLSEKENLETFAADLIERYGKIDVLIHNAGLSRKGILSACSYEDFLYVQKVGVAAPYYLTSLLKRKMGKDASIICMSSSRWNMSQPDTESYSASKGGIASLTHALAVSLGGKVRVNAISPGWIETGKMRHSKEDRRQHPVKKVGVPRDIVSMAMFLCSEESDFITGQNFVVDGGMSKQMIYHDDWGWTYKE